METSVQPWFIWVLLALVNWGFYGFFPKLAVRYVSAPTAILYQVLGGLPVALVGMVLVKFKPETHPKGVLFAGLTGMTALAGSLFYFAAAREERISVVAPITALYPVITIVLALAFLKEPISLKQGLGILLSVLAIVLLTT